MLGRHLNQRRRVCSLTTSFEICVALVRSLPFGERDVADLDVFVFKRKRFDLCGGCGWAMRKMKGLVLGGG